MGRNPYASSDLRRDLQRRVSFEMPLGRGRRIAAIGPLFLAMFLWFAIPSSADQPASVTITGPATAQPGDQVTLTVSASNDGDTATSPLDLSATVPSGYTVDQASGNTTSNGDTVTWHLGSVPAGGVAQETVTVTVPANAAPGQVDATATLSDSKMHRGALTADTTMTVPAAAPAPQAAAIAPSAAASSAAAGTPVTGAATELMRYSLVGLCLMISGISIASGLRFSPHAVIE